MTAGPSALSRRVGDWMDGAPELWRLAQQLRFRNSTVLRKFVTPEHHLVIEGFPRSGSSFAVRAFLHANGQRQSWSIGTHAHRIAQLSLAVKYRLPTLVLIREPRAAVVSLAAFQLGRRSTDAAVATRFIADRLRYYARYHRHVAQLQEHLLVSDFATTTGCFGEPIAALNDRFGTRFTPYSDDPADTAWIAATSRSHATPDPDREALKPALADVYDHPALANSRAEADNAYLRLQQGAL